MLIGHGDDAYLFDTHIVANFSSNVYYQGITEGLKKHLVSSMHAICTYPESNAQGLCSKMAQWHELSPEHIIITNGATEAFYLLAQSFRNKSASIVVPAFAEYEDACIANQLKTVFLSWEELHAHTRFHTDIVFLGNPNNPTGSVLTKETIRSVLAANPQTIFIIDEAYSDFTDCKVSMADELKQFHNLIIVRSLTKTFSIPGLRLGYLLSNPSVINSVLMYKMPWSVNSLAIEAGKYITENRKNFQLPLQQLLEDTALLRKNLSQIEYLTVHPSQTNYFLCQTHKGTAGDLKSFLLNTCGILIRDASNFRSLCAEHFRIATQTAEKNKLLIHGIKQWMINS